MGIRDKKIVAKHNKKNNLSWAVLLIIWAAYSYFSFQTPSQQAMVKYQLDAFQIGLLRVSIILPVLLIWSALLYSCLRLTDYFQAIIKSDDGKGFRLVTAGLFSMLVSSVATSYISLFIQFSQNNHELVKSLRILSNYTGVFFALLSFFLIWRGSKKLVTMINADNKVKKQGKIIWFSVLLLAFPYIYFVLQNPIRSVSSVPGINSTYNLPDVLIFTTIVAPYILTWLLGIYSVVNMSVFKEETEGIIYKNVFDKFYKGFLTVILLAISLQYLTQFSVFLSNTALSILLSIIYLILFVNIIGLVLVAEGAKQLIKIETI